MRVVIGVDAIKIIIDEISSHFQEDCTLSTPSKGWNPTDLGPPRPPRDPKITKSETSTLLTIQQTNEEKHYTFFDAASPTFMLVNSEVAEGDVGDVLPAFAKNFSVLILAGALIGLAGYIWDSRSVPNSLLKKLWVPTNYLYEVDKHRS